MSASYTRADRVLSTREREKFRREIQDRERALEGHLVIPSVGGTGPEGMSARRQGRWEQHMDKSIREDAGMLRAQISHMKRVLEKGSPRDLSRRERQMLEKQAAEDREYLKKNMVSEKTYFQREIIDRGGSRIQNPNFAKSRDAVYQKETANKEFQSRANRYKNNMRELDPENPKASDIEKFRPKR